MRYLDDYEEDVIEDKILLEVILALDSFKDTSFRTTTGVLDLLGDLGGVFQFFDIIICFFV